MKLLITKSLFLPLAILSLHTLSVTAVATPPQITSFSLLHSFTGGYDGGAPAAGLIQGTDGRLYGTAQWGGAKGQGTVFSVNPDGTGFTPLYSFTGANDGGGPTTSLIQGADGRLYGTTPFSGINSDGNVFAINTDGTGFTVLYSFTGGINGRAPQGSLIQGADGRLYGTLSSGGASGNGTVFALNTNGTGFTTLYSFTGGIDGGIPKANLMQGIDGRLYGGTVDGGMAVGGASGQGTVFAINTDGTGFTTLHAFTSGIDGGFNMADSQASLIQRTDGRIYGMASQGGAGGWGTVFAVNPDGTGFATLYSFTNGNDGGTPSASLSQGIDGRLYGMTSSGGSNTAGTVFAINTDGTGFAVLYSFINGSDNGAFPGGSLIQGTDGRFYGMTTYSGIANSGTIFAISSLSSQSVISGTSTTLTVATTLPGPLSYQWQFNGTNIADATSVALILANMDVANTGSYTAVVSNAAGSVTSAAATLTVTIPPPPSTPVFAPPAGTYSATQSVTITSAGAVSIYYTTDGSTPTTSSALYMGPVSISTTATLNAIGVNAGVSSPVASGAYTIDSPPTITTQPQFISFTTLHSFTYGNDGGNPSANVIQGTDGRLYGTTQDAGAYGQGTVFAVNSDGTGFATLYSFTAGNDGGNPIAGLTQGTDGRLYGTAPHGAYDRGTVFAVNSDGAGFATLYSFTGGNDGNFPYAGLIQGTDGRLYGTSSGGGLSGNGTVFAINPDGTGFATLYSFTGGNDGNFPYAGLIQGTDGRLYGTSSGGGLSGNGTVFAINPDGTGFGALYSFTGGNGPSSLIQGIDGRLYGTTNQGGANGGYGTVFAVNSDGAGFTTLYSFTGGNDGAFIFASLVQGLGGRLYGTTGYGGANGDGTVFAINPDGAGFATLYSFTGGNDGSGPTASLIQGTDGRLYGTAQWGGTYSYGTLFAISTPFVISGTSVTLTVAATGGTPLSYQWQFNGTNIAGATGATLALTNVNVANSGSYTVVVSNPYGSVTSQAAILTVVATAPTISAIAPQTATAGGSGFTLTVNGSHFVSGSQVLWNGSARPTTFVNGTTLTAVISASDIATTNALATALITVQSPGGDLSNTLSLPIVSSDVAAVQSNTAAAGGSTTVTTAPSTAGNAGVTTILQDNGSAPVAVTVADYTTNPTMAVYFNAGGGFVDLQVTGATAADTATACFYYPNTITGATEDSLVLLYFDGANWQPVLSSGGVAPIKNATDNLDGTVSGGRFTVVFDNTSTPAITNLTGTVFTVTVNNIAQSITVSPSTQTITAGGTVSFTAANGHGYTWSVSPAGTTGLSGSGASQTITFQHAGTYTVSVQSPAGGGYLASNAATATVDVIAPALVNQGITLNGNAKVTGSVQVLTGTPSSVNGNAVITGNLFVVGSPSVVLNGHPTYGGTLIGTGSPTPSNYQVNLNGNASLFHVVTRTDPATLPAVATPPAPTGAKNVTITSPGTIPASFVGIRDLTLSSGAGAVAIPAGTYGNLSVNGTASLILGVTGSTQASVYNLQQLTMNGTGQLMVAGPVILMVANGISFNGNAGSSAHPDWLTIELASGGLVLNGKANCYAEAIAPSSSVTINGNSTLTGSIACQQLNVNGNSVVNLLELGQ